ncbi:hypothetical protein [Pseudanabaena sp. FACHB-2040]|uniref:hypothetical protein n=1 Tax=Pseudanabaena sp. FACHB-2040 TaxID=2692859 RepID=UPI0016826452|nr:hypothetical protein [Pseudanabaena sp. FACHB-2040]MBD2258048.1 hypothetical protein [Pseudanabaena sp. FACHB-2040]
MKRKTALMFLSIATAVLIAAAVIGVFPAVMTPMMFDAPGSMENPATVTLAIGVATFPIVCVLAVVLSWTVALLPVLAQFPQHYSWACALTGLPLVNVVVAGLALAWLTVFNGGSFS